MANTYDDKIAKIRKEMAEKWAENNDTISSIVADYNAKCGSFTTVGGQELSEEKYAVLLDEAFDAEEEGYDVNDKELAEIMKDHCMHLAEKFRKGEFGENSFATDLAKTRLMNDVYALHEKSKDFGGFEEAYGFYDELVGEYPELSKYTTKVALIENDPLRTYPLDYTKDMECILEAQAWTRMHVTTTMGRDVYPQVYTQSYLAEKYPHYHKLRDFVISRLPGVDGLDFPEDVQKFYEVTEDLALANDIKAAREFGEYDKIDLSGKVISFDGELDRYYAPPTTDDVFDISCLNDFFELHQGDKEVDWNISESGKDFIDYISDKALDMNAMNLRLQAGRAGYMAEPTSTAIKHIGKAISYYEEDGFGIGDVPNVCFDTDRMNDAKVFTMANAYSPYHTGENDYPVTAGMKKGEIVSDLQAADRMNRVYALESMSAREKVSFKEDYIRLVYEPITKIAFTSSKDDKIMDCDEVLSKFPENIQEILKEGDFKEYYNEYARMANFALNGSGSYQAEYLPELQPVIEYEDEGEFFKVPDGLTYEMIDDMEEQYRDADRIVKTYPTDSPQFEEAIETMANNQYYQELREALDEKYEKQAKMEDELYEILDNLTYEDIDNMEKECEEAYQIFETYPEDFPESYTAMKTIAKTEFHKELREDLDKKLEIDKYKEVEHDLTSYPVYATEFHDAMDFMVNNGYATVVGNNQLEKKPPEFESCVASKEYFDTYVKAVKDYCMDKGLIKSAEKDVSKNANAEYWRKASLQNLIDLEGDDNYDFDDDLPF